MDYSNIVRVIEVEGSEMVNRYLQQRWKVLFVGQYENRPDGCANLIYSLGWPSDQGEPKEPQPKYRTLD